MYVKLTIFLLKPSLMLRSQVKRLVMDRVNHLCYRTVKCSCVATLYTLWRTNQQKHSRITSNFTRSKHLYLIPIILYTLRPYEVQQIGLYEESFLLSRDLTISIYWLGNIINQNNPTRDIVFSQDLVAVYIINFHPLP